jgi:hypothetical protein
MTTASWSTVLDQTSDAAFRTWGLELNTKFSAVGMVQTADTGQINWTTVTRAAVINTAAGYEIWKLSSGNLYFKIEYGTGNTQPTIPSLWITTGTGSNGSGTLTGQLSTRTQVGKTATAITSTSTNYQSYLCATANYFGLSWKIGSATTANMPRAFMAVAQTVDSTGTATTVGYFQIVSTTTVSTPTYQNVATTAGVTGTAIAVNNNFMLVPGINGTPANSLDGAGNNQAFLWWFNLFGTAPMSPLLHLGGVLATDLIVGNTATMTLVGSISHTYIDVGSSIMQDASSTIAASNLGVIMMWE